MPLALLEIEALERNLFEMVRPLVRAAPSFPWHRDRAGILTASRPESSQALAIDVLGTIDRLPSRDAILNGLARTLALTANTSWVVHLERTLPRSLLGEPRPTQLDATADGDNTLLVFEGKFTETDGGSCSQAVPLGDGAHAGQLQCNGRYERQTNPVTGVEGRCALTSKGVRYWEWVPRVLAFDPLVDHNPCPFRGGWYQWMRNLVASAALVEGTGRRATFLVLFADGPFPMAQKIKTSEWQNLRALAAGNEVLLAELSYQALIAGALGNARETDRPVLRSLAEWVDVKLALVAETA